MNESIIFSQNPTSVLLLPKDYSIYVIQQYFPFKEVLDVRLREVHSPSRAKLAKSAFWPLLKKALRKSISEPENMEWRE